MSADRPSLHPQNARVPDRGLERWEAYFRSPPVYVALEGDTKHESPLCSELRGKSYRTWCREESLYVFGERWCDACRWGGRCE